jgi:hypothetical protein
MNLFPTPLFRAQLNGCRRLVDRLPKQAFRAKLLR